MKNSEAILVTPKQFEIQDCAVPEPKEDEILLKVEYVGMCGSDIHGFEFGPYIPPKDPNQKIGLGHEVAGTVVKVGNKVTKFKVGDRALLEPGIVDMNTDYSREGRYNICPSVDFLATQPNYRGALCQYMTHPEAWSFHVPDNISTLEAALVEPAAVGIHAALLGGAAFGKSIVILGGGTIGLMVLQACKIFGATDITVVDVIEKRLELAKKLGATRVINGSQQDAVAVLREPSLYGDHGVELVFETAGATFTAQQAVQLVARGGKIVIVGTQSKPVPIDFLKINREVTIQTSFRYCNNFPDTIAAIASGKFNVKDLVTNIYDYQDVQQAFMDAIDPIKKTEMVKAVIKVTE
ncbi:NAD(P)-dependent alcohol dehydrogenase [Aggregatibacter actinomycetemcomitans]|nr:NAD(P)-dependent alcohol dehydrogenase [Aggregatibacter actinomycetemcomitans]